MLFFFYFHYLQYTVKVPPPPSFWLIVRFNLTKVPFMLFFFFVSIFYYDISGNGSFVLILLEFIENLGCIHYYFFNQTWKVFSYYFFEYVYVLSLSPFHLMLSLHVCWQNMAFKIFWGSFKFSLFFLISVLQTVSLLYIYFLKLATFKFSFKLSFSTSGFSLNSFL